MKKFKALIFLFILTDAFCFAQFNFSVQTGMLKTDVKEILWDKHTQDAQIISLLDWNTYIAPIAAFETEYKFAQSFLFGINGFYTLPFSYGQIEDFDYMNLISTGSNERTHYSKHKNKLNNYINSNLYFAASGKITKKLELAALFSLRYAYYCFTAYDGFKQYGTKTGTTEDDNYSIYTPWTADIPKVPIQGKIMRFEVQKLYFGIGTFLNYNPTDSLLVSLKLNLLPAFFCDALDVHYRRSNPYSYFDVASDLAFESSLLLEYKLNKSSSLKAGLDIFTAAVQGGNIFQSKNKTDWIEYADQTGIKESGIKFIFGYKYIYEK